MLAAVAVRDGLLLLLLLLAAAVEMLLRLPCMSVSTLFRLLLALAVLAQPLKAALVAQQLSVESRLLAAAAERATTALGLLARREEEPVRQTQLA